LAQRALALLEGGDPHGLRGAALTNLAAAQMTLGDIAAATRTLGELARVGQEGGHLISAVTALSNLAGLEHLQGRARAAIALCGQALDLCSQGAAARGAPLPLAGYAHVELGLITYDLNELARSRQHLVQGLEVGRQLRPTRARLRRRSRWRASSTWREKRRPRWRPRPAHDRRWPLSVTAARSLCRGVRCGVPIAHGRRRSRARWADAAGLSPADTPAFARTPEYITYARLLLAQGRPADAQTLLASLERYASDNALSAASSRSACCRRRRCRRWGSGRRRWPALRTRCAWPRLKGCAGRSWMAERPCLRSCPQCATRPRLRDSLLAAGPEPASGQPARGLTAAQSLVEPLSAASWRCCAWWLTACRTPRSQQLFVGVGTVKTHVHNILGKLGAEAAGRDRPRTAIGADSIARRQPVTSLYPA